MTSNVHCINVFPSSAKVIWVERQAGNHSKNKRGWRQIAWASGSVASLYCKHEYGFWPSVSIFRASSFEDVSELCMIRIRFTKKDVAFNSGILSRNSISHEMVPYFFFEIENVHPRSLRPEIRHIPRPSILRPPPRRVHSSPLRERLQPQSLRHGRRCAEPIVCQASRYTFRQACWRHMCYVELQRETSTVPRPGVGMCYKSLMCDPASCVS